jgi:hypothetical protein
VSAFLCRAVMCMERPFDGPIPRLGSIQYVQKNRFINFRSQVLNRKMPEGLMRIYLLISDYYTRRDPYVDHKLF